MDHGHCVATVPTIQYTSYLTSNTQIWRPCRTSQLAPTIITFCKLEFTAEGNINKIMDIFKECSWVNFLFSLCHMPSNSTQYLGSEYKWCYPEFLDAKPFTTLHCLANAFVNIAHVLSAHSGYGCPDVCIWNAFHFLWILPTRWPQYYSPVYTPIFAKQKLKMTFLYALLPPSPSYHCFLQLNFPSNTHLFCYIYLSSCQTPNLLKPSWQNNYQYERPVDRPIYT